MLKTISNNNPLQYSIIFILSFVVLSSIIFLAPGLFTTDDYYHIRISEMMFSQKTLKIDFPWLPRTLLSPDQYTDHHLLFHIYLAPFAKHFDIHGAKVAITLVTSSAFVAFFHLMKILRIRYALIWTVALLGMGPLFTIRMLMIRPNSTSLLFIILCLILLFSKRHKLLIPLSFLYTWLFSGFILLPTICLLHVISHRATQKSYDFNPLFYSIIGITLGVFLHPYFPNNISFTISHLLAKTNIDSMVIGEEWHPLSTKNVFAFLPGVILAIVFGSLYSIFNMKKRSKKSNTILFVTILTGAMASYSMRFYEYFAPFSLIFLASSWNEYYKKNNTYILLKLLPLILLAPLTIYSLWNSNSWAQSARPADELRGAALWLEKNTRSGELIFTVGYNDFSRLFYYNQQNTYLLGLDPTYLEIPNPNLYKSYKDILNGEVKNPSEKIKKTFNTKHIVSSYYHENFNKKAIQDNNLRLVFRDRYNYIWQIEN